MIFEPPQLSLSDPAEVATICIESGSQLILVDEVNLPAAFFDLSSGMAGELLHRLSLYQLRMAVVVADLTSRSERFQEFAREADRGRMCRFFATREAAAAWLQNF
jgi:hypothetical protein